MSRVVQPTLGSFTPFPINEPTEQVSQRVGLARMLAGIRMAAARPRLSGPLQTLLVILLSALLGPNTASGQSSSDLRVSVDPVCSTCSIRLDQVVDLGRTGDSAWAGSPTFNLTASKDRYFTVLQDVPGEVRVFSKDGRFIKALSAPRPGADPFGLIVAIELDRGDSLWVFDAVGGSVSVFSPNLTLERTVALSGRPVERGIHTLGNGLFLANMVINTPDLFGIPLHVMDSRGQVIRSFKSSEAAIEFGAPPGLRMARWISVSSNERFIAAHMKDYRVEQWELDSGRIEWSLSGSPPWFFALDEEPIEIEADWISEPLIIPPPSASIVDIHYDGSSDLLWIIGRTPDSHWRESAGEIRVADWGMYWDGVIEVFDFKRRELVARARVPDLLLGFLPDGKIYSYAREGDRPFLRIQTPILIF